MKIRRVEPILMSYIFPKPIRLPFWGGERTILKRDAMLIRITTDSGLKGFAPGPAHERAAAEIKQLIAPFLEGKDPRAWKTFQFSAPLETLKTYRSVEVALADLAAKDQGCALSELIGGRKRDRIRLYGSAGMYMSPDGYAEEAAAIAQLGFTAYKMRPALGPEQDLETVEKMRQAVGPKVGLMIDAHAWWRMGDRSYSFATIESLAREMARFHPTWLEEPLPPEDHAAYQTLREKNILPIASGEHEQEEGGFDDLISKRAVDYVQMDVCCQGGIAMGQRLFAKLEANRMKFAFHSWGTNLEVLAAAQLGICWPAETVAWLEHPCYANDGRPGMYPFPLADEILCDPLPIEDGDLIVPLQPGIGMTVNEKVIDRYPFKPGPWSFFQINSPPETIAVTGDHSLKWIAETPQA